MCEGSLPCGAHRAAEALGSRASGCRLSGSATRRGWEADHRRRLQSELNAVLHDKRGELERSCSVSELGRNSRQRELSALSAF